MDNCLYGQLEIDFEEFGAFGATATLITEPASNGEAWVISAAHVFERRKKSKKGMKII